MQRNQLNPFAFLLGGVLAFLGLALTVQIAQATPADDIEAFWQDLYVDQNPNFHLASVQFHWEVGVDEDNDTPEEAKQDQVSYYLPEPYTNIATSTVIVSSEANGAGTVYEVRENRNDDVYDYRVYDYGRIRIGRNGVMEVGPDYWITFKYDTTQLTPLLDAPAAADPDLLDKAQVDQCFNGGNGGSNPNNISEMLPEGVHECPEVTDNGDDDDSDTFPNGAFDYPVPLYTADDLDGGEVADDATYEKRNQAYVWSMFMDNQTGNLWYGTGPNIACLVVSSIFGTNPIGFGSLVCEFGSSPYGIANGLEAAAGDWRPPEIHMYDTATEVAEEVTPDADPNDLINDTMGIRATGVVNGVAILGGPSVAAIGGGSLSAGLAGEVNLFAYNADTGDFIESHQFPEYNDIRKWVVVNGVLYTSMKSTEDGSGHVLRWCGTLNDPFASCGGGGQPAGFEVVGIVPNGMGAYLAEHEGRIFMTTWPAFELGSGSLPDENDLAALFMSPVVPAGGLTSAHVDQWIKVWDVSEYEKDYITSFTYGGGALASLNGDLYWGTIHVQNIANLAATAAHGTAAINLDTDGSGEIDGDEDDAIQLGTHRPLSLFRGRSFGEADQEIELLYGLGYMPVHCTSLYDCGDIPILDNTGNNPNFPSYTIAMDAYHRNNMDQDPLWGPGGFWNMGNVYTWSMEVYKNRLYIGSYDSGAQYGMQYGGGDLFRIDCDHGEAVFEDLTGQGNNVNYGIRNMATDGEYLYLGMANPYNLNPDGGYELVRVGDSGAAGICGYDCEPIPGIMLSFDQVSTGGSCNAVLSGGSEPPDNYNFLGQAYEITVTGFSGPVEVCFAYNEADLTMAESRVAVMHRDDADSPWEDITSSRDTQANIVCGRSNSLSEFSAGEDMRPRAAGGGGGGCFISSAANTFFGL